MRKLLPLLALMALSAPAGAQEYAFAPQSETGFRQLLQKVQEGRAGADFTNANIGVDHTVVHVQLLDRSGGRHELTLSPPDGEGAGRSRFFKVTPGSGASADDAVQLARLLDESFASDPYILVWHGWNDPRPVPPAEPLLSAWRRGGWNAFSAAFVIQFLRPASLQYVTTFVIVHGLIALLCVGMLLSRRGLLMTIGVGLLSWRVLAWAYPVSPVIDDAALFMLLARDCVELGQCHLGGTMASLLDFSHGGAWVDLIVATRLLGGHADAVRIVVEAMDAVAIALVFHVVRRRLGTSFAWPTTALLLAELITGGRFVVPLSNTVSVAFPSILAALLLWEFSANGRLRYLAGASFFLAWAVSGHGSAGVLLPGFVIIGVGFGARPLRQTLLMLVVFALTTLSLYRQDAIQNFQALQQHHLLLPMLGGIAALVFVGILLRSRMASWSVGVLLAGPFVALAAWLILLRGGYNRWYEVPALAPICVLVVAAIHSLLRKPWIARVAVTVLVLLFVGRSVRLARESRAFLASSWTFTDAERVATEITGRGWTYEKLLHHLETPACRDVTSSLGLALPMADPPTSDSGRALRLKTVNGRTMVDDIASWLRVDTATVCVVSPSGESRCSPMSPMDRGLFFYRADPPAWSLTMEGPHVIRYTMPLVPEPGVTRRLQVLDSTTWPACRWRITVVEGATTAATLPAETAELAGTATSGRVILEQPIATPECPQLIRDDRRPPCLYETLPGESDLPPEAGPRIAGF